MTRIDFSLPLRGVSDMVPCECCGEPWCEECEAHYADCRHPGPHSEEDALQDEGEE